MSTDLNQKPFAGLEGRNDDDLYETAELASPDSGVHDNLDPEEKAKLEEEWKAELVKTEEEIQTLRGVLTAKVQHAHALKRKLGITPAQELRTDIQHTLDTVRSSDAYQKTSAALKTAGSKTAEVTHKVSDNVKAKMSDLKNSQMYKSFEEKVSLGYTNIKARVSGGADAGSGGGAAGGPTRPSNFDQMLDENGAVGADTSGITSKSAPVTPTTGVAAALNGGSQKA